MNDFLNAYQVSQSRRISDPRIAEYLEKGAYVVVEVGPEYCGHTDAILGEQRYMVEATTTLDEAEADADRRNRAHWAEGGDPEVYYRVISPRSA